jgi:hypothetical protein
VAPTKLKTVEEEVIMKKELTVFALAAGLTSFSLAAFAQQDEATKTRQPVKMTEQQLDHNFNKRSYRASTPTRATNPEIDRYIGELSRRFRSLEGRDEYADLIVALIRKLTIQAARLELIESGVIPTQGLIDLDNYQTPPKDPCHWSWVYCQSACEQTWWVYCSEGQ